MLSSSPVFGEYVSRLGLAVWLVVLLSLSGELVVAAVFVVVAALGPWGPRFAVTRATFWLWE